MKRRRIVVTAALGLVALASLTALPTLSQPATGEAPADRQAAREQHINARIQARLNRMAERLQIDASQQAAWAAYAQTVESLFTGGWSKPPADADAAALLRLRAERASAHAQKLTQLASATETLQQALTPEQRQTLDQMMRHKARGMHGRHRGHGRAG